MENLINPSKVHPQQSPRKTRKSKQFPADCAFLPGT